MIDIKYSFQITSKLTSSTFMISSPCASGRELLTNSRLLMLMGEHDAAALAYRSAISAGSNDADHCITLVDRLVAIGRSEVADALLDFHIARAPASWRMNFKQGELQRAAGNFSVAAICYRSALAVDPCYAESHSWPEVHWWLGQSLFHLGNHQDALSVMQSFVAISSAFPDAYGMIGTLLNLLGRHIEAIAEFERVMQITGDKSPQAAENLARISFTVSDWHRAKKYLGILKTIDGVPNDLKFGHAAAHLITGDFRAGWKLFDDALPSIGDPANPQGAQYLRTSLGSESQWRGEPLAGRRLLVWAEHGLGDALMMFRYMPLIAKRFGDCPLTLWVQAPLVRLFAKNGIAKVEVIGSKGLLAQADVDFHVSIMSLPNVFETFSKEDIPRAVSYLTVPSIEADRWAAGLQAFHGLKVGVVWAGNISNEVDQRRSISLVRLAPLFSVAGVSWISLQKGEAASQTPLDRWPVTHFIQQCADMMDTAALITNLDLVISVDTSVAHLAGALGCPVWLLNRHGSEWRWLLDQTDSPWYPSMRIFQQQVPGEWAQVIADVAQALAQLVEVHRDQSFSGLHKAN